MLFRPTAAYWLKTAKRSVKTALLSPEKNPGGFGSECLYSFGMLWDTGTHLVHWPSVA